MKLFRTLSVFISFELCLSHGYEASQITLSQNDQSLDACTLLGGLFPDHVFFRGSSGYGFRQSQYWSAQQSTLEPTCRYTPKSEADLRLAFHLLKQRDVQIAIESGGHSSNIGASNIDAGITIDMLYFSSITLTDANTAAWLGPAVRWHDVYASLRQHNLTVSGGRVDSVGVGGYILGGGFSWFSNERGWTCDSVLEFEVLVPSGQLLHARYDWNADLFWGLKGSLGAFGIVTAIKVPTFPDRPIYGGALSYGQDQVPALFAALQDLVSSSNLDLQSQGYLSFGYLPATDQHLCSTYLVNTAGNASTAAFELFTSIGYTHSSLRKTTLLGSATEISSSNPLGHKRSKFTLTAYSSVEAMQTIHSTFVSIASSLSRELDDTAMLGITFQPLTKQHLQAGAGNIFALDVEERPLLLLSAELWWSNAKQDGYYEQQTQLLHDAWKHELKRIGQLHPWLYPNYAASWQDPLSAEVLSSETFEALSKVREKYDPEDIWRTLVPGSLHI